jgi:hypothetical protein
MTPHLHYLAAALILGAAGFAAPDTRADSIRLDRPMAGASLHAGGVDMTVYYVAHDDHFEVVATYVQQDGPYDPARLRMGLSDGDDVSFGLPGLPGVLYRFARDGRSVTVDAASSGRAAAATTPTLAGMK